MQNNDIDLQNVNSQYHAIVFRRDDIISSLHLNAIEESKTIDIIKHLENTMGELLRDDKTIQLPYMGAVRRSMLNKVIIENHKEISDARKNMTYSEYKDYFRKIYNDTKNKIESKEKYIELKNKFIKNNKKKYDSYVRALNIEYAECFIFSLILLEPVEFNEEIEDEYTRIRHSQFANY